MYAQFRKYSPSVLTKKLHAKFYSDNPTKHKIETEKHGPRAFSDIPGPKSLPVIGTLYKYLPLIGEYSFTNLYESGRKRLSDFGPLVREEIMPNVNVIWIFKPDDIAEIFKAESGLHPERRSHLALLKYRNDRAHIYNTGGLIPTNGPEWWRIRKEFQKVTSKPQNVINYLEETDRVVREFVELCSKEKFPDFLPILSRLFLELTGLVVFDVRLNSFSREERHANSTSSKLIEAAFTTNSVILKLDNGLQLWRFFETPLYRKLRKAQTYMESVALELISRKKEDTKARQNKSLLNAYFENPALDIKDITGMACDMLLAGIDTTTYTTAFTLYHLAKNQDAQKKLRSEATQLLDHRNQPITAAILRNASYTKAVIKESLRLNPISIGIGRILQTDVVLGDYEVPKGTVVVTQNQIICRLPEYFEKPDSFIPERWLRESSESNNCTKSVNPYVLLPFGHGPRSCIARRFAEQNMQVLLLRLCQQLQFSWKGDELGMISLLINKPNAPLKFNFHQISMH